MGDIENIPVSANKADVIISNCVLNLVPDKEKVFKEIFRVLKPGGHFSVSDIVTTDELPLSIKNAAELYAGCIAGAVEKSVYLEIIKNSGFHKIKVQNEKVIKIPEDLLLKHISEEELKIFRTSDLKLESITIYAEKPIGSFLKQKGKKLIMEKIKILFVCVHNSARSQMAEAFVNTLYNDRFSAESAGLEPGVLNQFVVKSMSEIGIDISQNKTKDVFEFYEKGENYDYVITVCDEASGERCPVFPGAKKLIHWTFKDPSTFKGTEEELSSETAKVREEIKNKISEFINLIKK